MAATCATCGRLRMASSYTRDPGGYYRRECNACRKATKFSRPDVKERHDRTAALHAHERNEASREAADRWGYEWTGPELEIAARSDLSIAEIAARLRRTYQAVSTARSKMQRDPRYSALAGLARDEAP